jgi:hypothetical protein
MTPPSHPAPWQNPVDPLNADGDPGVTATDALVIINLINSSLLVGGALPAPTPGFGPPSFYDVDGDNHVSPTDVLFIINYLNSLPPLAGEGESVEVAQPMLTKTTSEVPTTNSRVRPSLIEFLAADISVDSMSNRHLGKRPGVR